MGDEWLKHIEFLAGALCLLDENFSRAIDRAAKRDTPSEELRLARGAAQLLGDVILTLRDIQRERERGQAEAAAEERALDDEIADRQKYADETRAIAENADPWIDPTENELDVVKADLLLHTSAVLRIAEIVGFDWNMTGADFDALVRHVEALKTPPDEKTTAQIADRVGDLLDRLYEEDRPLSWPRIWLTEIFRPRLLAVIKGEPDPGPPKPPDEISEV